MAILGRGIAGLPLSSGSMLVGVGGVIDELPIGLPGQVLTVVDNPSSTEDWVLWQNPATGSSGSGTVTGGQNLFGSGAQVYSGLSGTLLQFRRIVSGSSNVTVTEGTNEITISVTAPPVTSVNTLTGAVSLGISNLSDVSGTPSSGQVLIWNGSAWTPGTPAASGEVNVGANLGTGTILYAGKSGTTLQFNSLKAGPGIGIALANNEITITNTDRGSSVQPGLSSVGIASPLSTLSVTGSPLTANGTLNIDLPAITGVSGVHPVPSSITVDGYGRITAITNGTVVNTNKFLTFNAKDASSATASSDTSTFTFTGTDVTTSITGTTMNINLASISGLTPGSYTHAAITVDSKGRITAAANGTLPNTFGSLVTDSGTSLAGSPGSALTVNGINGVTTSVVTNNVKVGLTPSGVTAGTYGATTGTAAQLTVDTYGRVTAAQNKVVLQSVSQDLNPALGGNLNVGPYEINTSSADGNITLRPNGVGTVNVSGARITSLASPISASDAATKAYVDAHAGSGSALEIDSNGTLIDSAVSKINFTGTGVSVSQTAAGQVHIDITGGGNIPSSELINSTNVAESTNTITISNIPNSYDDLYMVIIGNVDGAQSDVVMSVNGDTGANYGTATWNKFGADTQYSVYPARITTMEGNTIHGTLPSETLVEILGYGNTTFGKKARAVQQYTEADESYTTIYEWNWSGTSAVTSITLTSVTGSFAPGTTVKLYGRGGILSPHTGSGVTYLDDLLDVSISNLAPNQTLSYNGSGWVNRKLNVTDLGDALINSVQTGQILVYNGTKWANQSPQFVTTFVTDINSAGVNNGQISVVGGTGITTSGSGDVLTITNTRSALYSLDDIDFTTAPTANQVIQYNGTKWVPYTIPDYALNSITDITADDSNSIAASTNSTTITVNGTNGINTSVLGNSLKINFAATLDQLTNVTLTGLSNGDSIVYNSSLGKWINAHSTSTIAGLNDVDVSLLSNNYILKYNSSTLKWEAVPPSTIDQNIFSSVSADDSNIITASSPTSNLLIGGMNGIVTSISGSTVYVGQQINLNQLADVSPSIPSTGQVLAWNGISWAPSASPIQVLDDLTDVVITSPSVNQTLVYDGTQWANSLPNTLGSILGNSGTIPINSYNKAVTISGSSGITTTVAGNTLQISLSATLDQLSDVAVLSPNVGDILYWAGSSWQAQAGGSFSLISDPNPTLGADLETNGHSIVSASGQDVVIQPSTGGETVIGDVRYSSLLTTVIVGTDINTLLISYSVTFTYAAIDYHYESANGKRIGTLMVLTDGTDVSITDTGTELGTPDVVFTATVSGLAVAITLTTPDDSTIKFTTRKF